MVVLVCLHIPGSGLGAGRTVQPKCPSVRPISGFEIRVSDGRTDGQFVRTLRVFGYGRIARMAE